MVYRVRGADAPQARKVFIAVPAYGDMPAPFVYSVWSAQAKLFAAGICADLELYAGDCHVDDARNRLVRDFLESDCQTFVFLDADLLFEPDDLVRLIESPHAIAAGIYPLKQGDESYPVRTFDGDRLSVGGWMKVSAVPTGFLKIEREVLETLHGPAKKYHAKADGAGRLPIGLIFERTLSDGQRWGGDYTFCIKASQAGYAPFIDPEMRFGHVGAHTYQGCVGEYWRRESSLTLHHCLSAIRNGEDTNRVMVELSEWWGNPRYAAAPEFLQTVAILAREGQGPIIEAGTGLTTLVMAAAAPHREITALEHDPVWYARILQALGRANLTNVRLQPASGIENGWYVAPAMNTGQAYTLAVCDGPPRNAGDRTQLWKRANLSDDCVVVIDDCDYPIDGLDLTFKHGVRAYAIGRRIPTETSSTAA